MCLDLCVILSWFLHIKWDVNRVPVFPCKHLTLLVPFAEQTVLCPLTFCVFWWKPLCPGMWVSVDRRPALFHSSVCLYASATVPWSRLDNKSHWYCCWSFNFMHFRVVSHCLGFLNFRGSLSTSKRKPTSFLLLLFFSSWNFMETVGEFEEPGWGSVISKSSPRENDMLSWRGGSATAFPWYGWNQWPRI